MPKKKKSNIKENVGLPEKRDDGGNEKGRVEKRSGGVDARDGQEEDRSAYRNLGGVKFQRITVVKPVSKPTS